MFGGLFKLGNDNFHETLPKVVILVSWVDIIMYGLAAVMCFVALAGTILEVLGAMLAVMMLIQMVYMVLMNYIIFWACRTRNKCWMTVISGLQIFGGLNNIVGITGESAFHLMDGVPILGIAVLVASVFALWLGILCAMACGKVDSSTAPATVVVVQAGAAP